MGRIILSRLRRIVPDPGWLIACAVFFLFFEGVVRYLEFKHIPIFARLRIQPGHMVLLVACRPAWLPACRRVPSDLVGGL